MREKLLHTAKALFKQYDDLNEVYIKENGVGFRDKQRADAEKGKTYHFNRQEVFVQLDEAENKTNEAEEVENTDVQNDVKETEDIQATEETQEPTERETLILEYEALSGKKAAHNISVETLKERITELKKDTNG